MRASVRAAAAVLVGSIALTTPQAGASQQAPPPAGSPPVLVAVELRFPTQPDGPQRQLTDYWTLMALPQRGVPVRGRWWLSYHEITGTMLDDAQRLWKTGWLHSVWVDVVDEPFPNGVRGKRVVFSIVERLRPGRPPRGYPSLPPGYASPPAGHVRVYPPRP